MSVHQENLFLFPEHGLEDPDGGPLSGVLFQIQGGSRQNPAVEDHKWYGLHRPQSKTESADSRNPVPRAPWRPFPRMLSVCLPKLALIKLKEAVPVSWVADFLGARRIGESNQRVTGINEIQKVEPGDISFVDHEKYYKPSLASPATVILIDRPLDCPFGKTLLVVEDPFSAYVRLCEYFSPFRPATESWAKDLILGEGSHIQPGVFIGHDVQIGKNCLIHPQDRKGVG